MTGDQHILDLLKNLDDGQIHIIKRIGELERKIDKLDDPDIGRMTRAENQIKALEKMMGVMTTLRDRGVGVVIGVIGILLLIGAGLGAGIKQLAHLLFN